MAPSKFLLSLVLVFALHLIEARPPVKAGGRGVPSNPATNDSSDWNLGLEYNRYLQEVVQVLESDPEFRKKLETADVEKIRDGSIATELEMVNHQIRSELDVIKRRELERLRHLAMRQYEVQNGINKSHVKFPQHIEIQSPTFEIDDLRKLIKTTTKDLEEADKKRRNEFKRYEMEKKFEHEQRLSHIEDEQKRKDEEARMMELEKKHRQHEQLNHPMTKEQLEEVWENQDHMRSQDWDPKTFFAMHDLNGDKFWDEDEIRVLFKKELDKVYDPNAPEDDMREREEEMERMREHVFRESDTDKNKLISFNEFLAETKREEFEKDPGWNTLDQGQDTPFTDEEFKAFEMQRMREIQGMINRGVVPEGYPYYGGVPPGAPIHPQLGVPGQQAYIAGAEYPNMPMHPGPGQFPSHTGMNIQPLRGEQQYNRQPLPQFVGAQPQNQFGQARPQLGQPQQLGQVQQYANVPQQQQQFDRGQPRQQQQFNAQQQQYNAPLPLKQQYNVPQQQQQQLNVPEQNQQQYNVPQQQQQQLNVPEQQQQQYNVPPQQQQQQQQQQKQHNVPPPQQQQQQQLNVVEQEQPVEASVVQAAPPQQQPAAVQIKDIPQPQARGQPVLRAQKPIADSQQSHNP